MTGRSSDLIGWLAVRSGRLRAFELDEALRLQRQLAAEGAPRPLGALLVERGLLEAEELAILLAEQRSSRGETGPAPARMTEEENRLLGEILVWNDLADEANLEECRREQAERAARGEERKLGEILLDRGLLDGWGVPSADLARPEADPGAPVRWAPRHRGQPGASAWEGEVLDGLDRLGLVGEEDRRRIEDLGRALEAEGLRRTRVRIAIDLGVLDREGAAQLIELVPDAAAAGGLEDSIRLTPHDESYLRQYLEENGLAGPERRLRAERVVEVYRAHGIAKTPVQVLAELGGLDRSAIGRAVEIQRRRNRILRLYFGGMGRSAGGEGGRFRVEVAASPDPREIGRGFDFEDGEEFLVGRSVPQGFRLDNAKLSKIHARLAVLDGLLEVTDLGSRNGTYFEGRRIEQATLGPGRELRLGDTVLRFLDREAAPTEGGSADLREIDLAGSERAVDPFLETCVGDDPPPEPGERIRSVFREFYSRETQLRKLREEPGCVEPRATPSRRYVVLRARRGRSLSRAGGAGAAAFAAALALAGIAGAVLRPGSAGESGSPPGGSPSGSDRAPPRPEVGETIAASGEVRSLAVYLSADGRSSYEFTLVTEDTALYVHGQGAPGKVAEGRRVVVRGAARPIPGRPVRLPDGRATDWMIEIESVGVVE